MVTDTLRPLCSQERNPVPILYEAAWALGLVLTATENAASTWILSPDRPSRSQSLDRPSAASALRSSR